MNQNLTTTTDTNRNDVQRSKPIPISTERFRNRSTSFSSDLSNSPPLATPKNFPTAPIPVSSSSPILYYLSQSPTKTSATFPFRGFAPPVLEDEPAEEFKPHTRARRDSTAGRFQPQPPPPDAHHERGVNVLRRLSLGGQRPKLPPADVPPGIPNSPPKSAPIMSEFSQDRKPRRSATVVEHTRPRRAPSPMGERILKGHFDGFN